MTRRAAVVGGGIGGLAAAIGLTAGNWEVTVFERAEDLPKTGTGLGMWPSAMRALDQLGVGAAARAAGRPQANGHIRRPDGSRIATVDVERLAREQGEPVYLLSRPALLRLLAEAVPDGVVRFGDPVTGLGALRHAYDLVVGADGANSVTRATLFPDHRLRYAGATVWRGVTDLDLVAGGETWGRGVKFGLTPQEPGKTNWYAVLSVPRGYRPADDVAELRRVFGSWHEPIPTILSRYADSDVLHHDLAYLDPPLPSYVVDNVVLIGDAAHAMTPDLGQGACQTLIDAAALAECLRDASVPEGLARFDALRREPTQKIAANALRVSRLTQWRRGLWLRNTLTRLALAVGPPA